MSNFQRRGRLISGIILGLICCVVTLLVCRALDQRPRRVQRYPFEINLPVSWLPVSEQELARLRGQMAAQANDLYKKYSGYTGEPFTTVPYMLGFYSPDRRMKIVAAVQRFPPQTNYFSTIVAEQQARFEFGTKQGILRRVVSSETNVVTGYNEIQLDCEIADGSRAITVHLFDEELPYQVVELMMFCSNADAAEAHRLLDEIISSMKIDFTLRGVAGNEPFVLSKRCQEFFIVTEISSPDAKRFVFVIQEPHWDWVAQWNLHQGLRVIFHENTNLLAKSVFLSEGTKAMAPIAVSPLTQVEPAPDPKLVKATLESFLVTGYLTFNWMTSSQVPVLGTEDWPIYQESARLWENNRNEPWAVTVSARNEKMAEMLAQTHTRYDNPILFVGGMHLHGIAKDLFAKGQAVLDVKSPALGKPNRGVKDWLKENGIDYIYMEPVPEKLIRDNDSAVARYRELFTAQKADRYNGYVEKFEADYERRLALGAYDDGVTVTAKPAEAAKLVAILKKKSGGDGESDKPDDKNEGSKRGKAQKPIDRYKDGLSKVNLRGKNLKSGRNAIKDADPNLNETRDDDGRHEWRDKNGTLRFRYDPAGAHVGAHWDKFAPDTIRIDNAGRPGVEHIPAK